MIGVTHNTTGGKTYANLATIMGLPKGMDKPKAAGELIAYDIDSHDATAYEKLPGWLQEAIKERVASDADKTVDAGGRSAPEFDDEIPF
jgi:hypothetical protein